MQSLYLAYGSNLHPVRLSRRVSSVQLLGTLQLPGYQLHFHKRGQDGSGKCNILPSSEPSAQVYSALYSIADEEIPLLDQFEGVGYQHLHLELELDGESHQVLTYVADESYCDDDLQPYRWYQQLVYWGGRFHEFPDHYLNDLASVPVIEDRDLDRSDAHVELLAHMGAPVINDRFD